MVKIAFELCEIDHHSLHFGIKMFLPLFQIPRIPPRVNNSDVASYMTLLSPPKFVN